MTEPAEPVAPSKVVVGVDGSEPSLRAVDWAAAEAWGCAAGLRIVQVLPFERAPRHGGPDMHLEEAQLRLRDLADHARLISGGPLAVEAEVVDGAPGRVLLDESAPALMLVLGSRGLGRFARVLLGSTALDVALRAACPVAIIPADADLSVPRAGVVVGVDAAAPDEEALRFAFERADRLREPLTAVYVRPGAEGGTTSAQADAARSLDAALARCRGPHPGVVVHARAVPGDAAAELRAASLSAESVVLGAGRRSALLGVALGSVSHGLLHDAGGPVIVVR